MNFVLDTNVILSGLLWKGTPHKVLQKVIQQHNLVQSPETLTELEEVLKRVKFVEILKARSLNVEIIIQTLIESSSIFVISKTTKKKTNTISINDEDDRIFLELVLESRSKYIISGDNHLLKIGLSFDIAIITANQFLNKKI